MCGLTMLCRSRMRISRADSLSREDEDVSAEQAGAPAAHLREDAGAGHALGHEALVADERAQAVDGEVVQVAAVDAVAPVRGADGAPRQQAQALRQIGHVGRLDEELPA